MGSARRVVLRLRAEAGSRRQRHPSRPCTAATTTEGRDGKRAGASDTSSLNPEWNASRLATIKSAPSPNGEASRREC